MSSPTKLPDAGLAAKRDCVHAALDHLPVFICHENGVPYPRVDVALKFMDEDQRAEFLRLMQIFIENRDGLTPEELSVGYAEVCSEIDGNDPLLLHLN